MNKVIKLKNKYTGDVFCTHDIDVIVEVGELKFVRVFHEKQPERTFLVNRDAFDIVSK